MFRKKKYAAAYGAAVAAQVALGEQIAQINKELAAISAQRPTTVYEMYDARKTAAEIARLQKMYGGDDQ